MYGVVFPEPVRKQVGRSDTRAVLGAAAGAPLPIPLRISCPRSSRNHAFELELSPFPKGGEEENGDRVRLH